jgi:hypothetical protein
MVEVAREACGMPERGKTAGPRLLSSDAAWLVWSNEHRRWWRPNHRGYTTRQAEAGRYPYTEALDICDGAGLMGDGTPAEIMTPSPEAIRAAEALS